LKKLDGLKEAKKFEKVTSALSHQFTRIFEAAGCEDMNFHDMRHEATSRLFERTDMSDFEIMKITGHSSTQMLARYANLRGSDLAKRMW
jgi:integrase